MANPAIQRAHEILDLFDREQVEMREHGIEDGLGELRTVLRDVLACVAALQQERDEAVRFARGLSEEDSFADMETAVAEAARLREAIERDAAEAAYKAGLGAGEWAAFVGKHSWAVLSPVPGQPATEGEAVS